MKQALITVGVICVSGFLLMLLLALLNLKDAALTVGYAILAPTPLWIFLAIVAAMLLEEAEIE